MQYRLGLLTTIQMNRGGITAVDLRESLVEIQSATKMQILFLNSFATTAQRMTPNLLAGAWLYAGQCTGPSSTG